MAKVTSKDRILDAAEALACEMGVVELTLDAVAARAGVSKGGLLYHFPNKDTLLETMLSRRLGVFEEAQTAVAAKRRLSEAASIRAFLEAGIHDVTESKHFCRAMLAATVNNPRLLKPVRTFLKQKLKSMGRADIGRDRAVVLWLAMEGLRSLEMFDVSPLTAADRRRIAAYLLELAKRKF